MAEARPFTVRRPRRRRHRRCRRARRAASAVAPALVGRWLVLAIAAVARRPALRVRRVPRSLAAGLADRALAGLHPASAAPVARLGDARHRSRTARQRWRPRRRAPRRAPARGHRVRRGPPTSSSPRLAGERVEVSGRRATPARCIRRGSCARRVVGSAHRRGRARRRRPGILGHVEPPTPCAARSTDGAVRPADDGSRRCSPASCSATTASSLRSSPTTSAPPGSRTCSPCRARTSRSSGRRRRPVLTRLRWRARLPATLAVLGGFALLVRFEPSVLRAGGHGRGGHLAAALGRPAAGIRILGLAVTALVLVDPLLVRSVGFGLSVGASAAILVLGAAASGRGARAPLARRAARRHGGGPGRARRPCCSPPSVGCRWRRCPPTCSPSRPPAR